MIDHWEWDVALLQECPPWWPEPLAAATGAVAWHRRLTSRNAGLALRRAIAVRNPDLMKANGGGSNAILLRRGPIAEARERRLTWRPERRWLQAVRTDGVWVGNVHCSQRRGAEPDTRRALQAMLQWAPAGPLVLGGDLNLTAAAPVLAPLRVVASRHVDHVAVRGFVAAATPRMLDHGDLSDHRPVLVDLRRE